MKVALRLGAPLALDVRFEVRGFTALLGRSGAGKTTLLRALAGLLRASGEPWPGAPAQKRPVGYLPQGAALFPHLSVLRNVAYALRGTDRLAAARRLLEELGLGSLAERSAATISGGEAQRVALARALARRPELLLLDEPTAALDAVTRDQVMLWLVETIAARGLPALAATHDAAVAGLADWLVLLDGGRIVAEGAPRALFEQPGTAAAAALLGYENIWIDAGCHYAIRAEDVAIADSGLPALILSARVQGRQLRLTCDAGRQFTVLLPAGDAGDYPPGRSLFLRLPPDRLKRLDG